MISGKISNVINVIFPRYKILLNKNIFSKYFKTLLYDTHSILKYVQQNTGYFNRYIKKGTV